VHHFPDGLISAMPQLTLHLLGRKTLLGAAHKCHGLEPMQKGELAPLHDCAAAKCGTEGAILALPLLSLTLPIVSRTAASAAMYTFLFTVSLEYFTATCLVRETTAEIE